MKVDSNAEQLSSQAPTPQTAIHVTLLMMVSEAAAAQFFEGLPQLIKETQSAPGCLSVRAMREEAHSSTVLFVEQWASTQAFNDYIGWRTERGDMQAIAQVLTEPPQIRTWLSM